MSLAKSPGASRSSFHLSASCIYWRTAHSCRLADRLLLFRQCVLAVNVEMASDNGRAGIRLTATDADGVVPRSNDRIAVLGHHTQVAIPQLEMNFPACTWIEMNSLKSSESNKG